MQQPQTMSALRHFDKVPAEWDALYSHENRLKYLVNRALRPGLFDRYEFAFREIGDLSGRTVLDLGCGTGRFSIESAKRGAARVVGLDFAPSMIEFSRRVAREMGVSDRCEFMVGDVASHRFDEKFDIVLAMGLFDYIERPEPLFQGIARLAPKKFIASFPRHSAVWGLQRHVRYYWIRRCPIYYYRRDEVEVLYRCAGFSSVRIQEARSGFVAVGEAPRSTDVN